MKYVNTMQVGKMGSGGDYPLPRKGIIVNQTTRVSGQASALGPPTPSPRRRVLPPPLKFQKQTFKENIVTSLKLHKL
jgi:hypothetical protein